MTEAMIERAALGGKWRHEGAGYFSCSLNSGVCLCAYIALPKSHPLVGHSYNDLEDYGPDINGGMTFSDENVFGWDYGNLTPTFDVKGDTKAALEWFRERDPNFADPKRRAVQEILHA